MSYLFGKGWGACEMLARCLTLKDILHNDLLHLRLFSVSSSSTSQDSLCSLQILQLTGEGADGWIYSA